MTESRFRFSRGDSHQKCLIAKVEPLDPKVELRFSHRDPHENQKSIRMFRIVVALCVRMRAPCHISVETFVAAMGNGTRFRESNCRNQVEIYSSERRPIQVFCFSHVARPAAASAQRLCSASTNSECVPDQLAKVKKRNAIGPFRDLENDVGKMHKLVR